MKICTTLRFCVCDWYMMYDRLSAINVELLPLIVFLLQDGKKFEENMGKNNFLSSVRLRIYALLWTAGCLTHFTWQSFDFSVICLRQEVIKLEAESLSINESLANLNKTIVERAAKSLKWLGPAFASWSVGTLVVNIPTG